VNVTPINLDIIGSAELARPDYVSVAHPDTLEELKVVEDRALLSMAVFVGGVRLIDNMPV
jgi:pantoate--beta-alanine ligase